MSFFSKKRVATPEEISRDFYENYILNPMIGNGKVDVNVIFSETIKKLLVEADQNFVDVSEKKIGDEIIILRFELFALAWMHKFAGKLAITQSLFTKRYLHEKGRNDIWKNIEHYNKFVNGATLNWLANLGKMNLGFWYRMREDLTKKNDAEGKIAGAEGEVITRANNRLCSENAWKQKIIPGALALAFCENLNLDPNELSEEASFRLAAIIRGLYDGAYQSFDNIKLVHKHDK